MEVREIDGKKFVEYEQYKVQRKRMIIQILFIIGIVYATFTMAQTIKTLISERDIINSDPIIYGMDAHGFISCQCFDEQGLEWYSAGERFITQQQAGYEIKFEVVENWTGGDN